MTSQSVVIYSSWLLASCATARPHSFNKRLSRCNIKTNPGLIASMVQQMFGLHLSLCGLLVVTFFPQGSQGIKCENGWFPYERSCYGYFQDKVTWNEAELECLSQGAESHLASILNEKEMNAVSNSLQHLFKIETPIWIGLYDKGGTHRRWRWIDLSAVNYAPWGKNEPNNKNGKEDCAAMRPTNLTQWNDENCNMRYNYLCKITKS
ncbi:regenerating islet-derived protein 4 [Anolis carolinensis]|uniref:regenerating islet-derived protein 4 n=1 Tax=Anolis carolinensis TaxID=28377 RepID=UPI002F2B6879